MPTRRTLLAALLGLGAVPCLPVSAAEPVFKADAVSTSKHLPLPFRLDALPQVTRDRLLSVIQSPTMTSVGPARAFDADAKVYKYLLDNPDRVCEGWRRLKVPAIEIKPTRDGRYYYADDAGNELVWQLIGATEFGRVWFAEGKCKASALVPSIPVQAVIVLRHKVGPGDRVTHQAEVYAQTDSKAATIVLKIMGNGASQLAEGAIDQMQYSFGGLAKHLHAHPEATRDVLGN